MYSKLSIYLNVAQLNLVKFWFQQEIFHELSFFICCNKPQLYKIHTYIGGEAKLYISLQLCFEY